MTLARVCLAIAALSSACALATAPRASAQSSGFDLQRNVEYGTHDGVSLLADLYTPAAPGKYPTLVAVHGAGWQGGSKSAYQYWGPWLAQRGYAVLSIDYRLASVGRKMYPESVHDTRAAIQWARSKGESIKINPDRIALTGDSAGAHLASLVGLAGDHPNFRGAAYMDDPYASVSAKVKAVVPAYGVFDMVQQWNHDLVNRPYDQITEKYLGLKPMDDRKLYFEASPMSYVTRDKSDVAFFMTYGTEDDIVDRAQSDAFLLALKQNGNFARRIIAQGSGHFWYTDPIEEPGSVSGLFAPRMLRFLQDRL